MRTYIENRISIDGRNIPYKIFHAQIYLEEKGYTEEEIEELVDSGVYTVVNQILALKQSCFLLRRVSHSCGSLAVDLIELKYRLIHELRDKHNFEFDEDFVEDNCGGSIDVW